jgi:hypothetical protein
MSTESDTETLFEEPIANFKTKSHEKLYNIAYKLKVGKPITTAWTRQESLEEEPGWYYDKSGDNLGKRGLEWRQKFLHGITFKLRITELEASGYTKDEIVDKEPEYYYSEEYHNFSSERGFRRIKSTTDLRSAVGTSEGYSGWEWCGERTS